MFLGEGARVAVAAVARQQQLQIGISEPGLNCWPAPARGSARGEWGRYGRPSTVTDFARLRGWSTSQPHSTPMEEQDGALEGLRRRMMRTPGMRGSLRSPDELKFLRIQDRRGRDARPRRPQSTCCRDNQDARPPRVCRLCGDGHGREVRATAEGVRRAGPDRSSGTNEFAQPFLDG